MPEYRRKPVIVNAKQFFVNKKPWPKGVYPVSDGQAMMQDPNNQDVTLEYLTQYNDTEYYFAIDTPRGVLKVWDKDWIIKGEFFPCKPDIFERDYEEIKDTAVAYCDGSVHCASKEETHEVQVRKDINCDKAEIEQEQFAKWAEHQFWNEDSSNTPASEEKTYVG